MIWRNIEGANGYQVSDTGKVRKKNNDPRCPAWRILKGSANGNGYYHTSINSRLFLVHRLVAIAFIPNPENKPFINHIDLNRKNNHVSNLEWCTQKENINHSIKLGSFKNKNGKKIIDSLTGIVYGSMQEASVLLKLPYSTLECKIRKTGSYKTLKPY